MRFEVGLQFAQRLFPTLFRRVLIAGHFLCPAQPKAQLPIKVTEGRIRVGHDFFYPNDHRFRGFAALFSNAGGSNNTANGFEALSNNRIGTCNTATGSQALFYNTIAFGNTIGSYNTASGYEALYFNIGNANIALVFRGYNVLGVAGESNTIRIGNTDITATYIAGIAGATVTGSAVYIDTTTGQLGLLSFSERFKDGIEPMGNASEALLSLRPVTFRYKKNIDPKGAPQFGLVAEHVEKVNPDLVLRDTEGKVFAPCATKP